MAELSVDIIFTGFDPFAADKRNFAAHMPTLSGQDGPIDDMLAASPQVHCCNLHPAIDLELFQTYPSTGMNRGIFL